MNIKRSIPLSFLGISLLLFSPALLFGQSEKGAIRGVVTDGTGAVVQGATVKITHTGTKTTQTLTTNSEGFYESPFLSPATYEVSATAQGFGETVNNNVVLNVGSRINVDLELRAGGVEGNVLIVDAAQLLQTETASIGQVIDNKQITELPSGDRNIYSFILLNSNVNQPPGGNGPAFRLESGGSFSISGTRPSTATFKIDGLSNTDPTFGTPTITPSLDSVQEFQVQNSAYSAEYEGIGQINVATKAGTSRIHGSLFEFLRNDKLQPRNPIAALDKDGKPGRGKLRFNQFGGTIGGPLWIPRFGEGGPAVYKGDTFFFVSYEGRRHNTITTGVTRVLTAAERSGDFSSALGACLTVGGVQVPQLNPSGLPTGNCVRAGQIFDPATTVANPRFSGTESPSNPRFIRQPFPNNRIPTERLNPLAVALINFQQGLPNIVSGTNNFAAPAGAILENNQTSVRIDHKFSDSDSIYGRVAVQNNARFNQGVLPHTTKNLVGNGRVISTTWTHVFSPTFVNEFRLGYVRGVYGESIDEVDAGQFGVTNTSLATLPGINITGNVPAAYGGFSASVLQTVQNTYQLANNVSMVRGNHSIRFGFKGDHNRFKNGELGNGANGVATFSGLYTRANSASGLTSTRDNSIADFLLGLAQSSNVATPSIANVRNTPWAIYLQDDWKFSKRITLNLGLRYEYHQPFREQLLGGARFDPTGGGRLIVANPEIAARSNTPLVVCCTDPQVVEADKMDFGPRVGIAIQPFKSDPTVIRAGYGIFYADSTQFFHWRAYEPIPDRVYNSALTSGDFTRVGATLGNLFPNSAFTRGGGYATSFGLVPPAILNNQPFIGSGNSGALYAYNTPYSQQWSFSVQREVLRNMLVEVNYTGSNSKNLPIQWIFSQAFPSPVAASVTSPDPAANPFLRRPYPNFNIGAFATTNVLQSNYKALTIKADKRFSKGYSFLATYTRSKSIDQGSEVFALGSTFNILADNNNFNQDKGLSTFDVPHRFVLSGIYDFPFGRGKRFLNGSGLLNAIVGGWRTSAVFQIQSGYPFSPNIRNRRANTGYALSTERGDLIGDPNWSDDEWERRLADWQAGIGGNLRLINPAAISLDYAPGTFGNIPRNFFRAPFARNLDFSVAKVTRFGEVTNMELRIDVLGATNERLHRFDTASRVLANNLLTNVNVGSIPARSSIFAPRIIQLGVKFIF